MNLLTSFLASWRIIGVATLLLIIGLQHIRSLKDELEIDGLKNQSHLETVVRTLQTQVAKNNSERVKNELNTKIPKLVEQAKRNAQENYRRRYHDIHRDSLGSGIRGNPAIGMRDTSADSAGAIQAQDTESAGRESSGLDAHGTCDPRFLADAAEAAAKLQGWEIWRLANGLEYE